MHGYSGMGEGWVLYSYPIHMCISQDNVSYLRLLLLYGADPLKEYSDFSSVNKYHTTNALLEAAKRKKHLHTVIVLQHIPTLERKSFGINDATYELVRTSFVHLAGQEGTQVLLDLLIEMAGRSVVDEKRVEVTSNPLKLKQICRNCVRKSYRSFLSETHKNTIQMRKVVAQLPLPNVLINYLLLEGEVRLFECGLREV